MKRELQGRYVTISTVGEKAQAFVPLSAEEVLECMSKLELFLHDQPEPTPATVNKALGHLEQLGIVKELTAQKRTRLFSYAAYIEIMSRGTELPGR